MNIVDDLDKFDDKEKDHLIESWNVYHEGKIHLGTLPFVDKAMMVESLDYYDTDMVELELHETVYKKLTGKLPGRWDEDDEWERQDAMISQEDYNEDILENKDSNE